MKLNRTLLFILGLSLLITACHNNRSPASPDSQAKDHPSDVQPPLNAQRVVALTSLSADIIHRLDSSKLIGIPGSRLLTANKAFDSLPKVSEGRTLPNLETIIGLKPDLVIGAPGFHDATLSKLKELGIQTFSRQIDSWNNLENFTQDLATQVNGDASDLLTIYRDCQSNKYDQQKSILMLVSHQPILAPNKKSWAGQLLTTFDFKNSVAELQNDGPMAGFVTLSEEKVLTNNPDIILVVNADSETLEGLSQRSFWSQLKAIQTNQVHQVDYYGMVNPGSIESIQNACTQLKNIALTP